METRIRIVTRGDDAASCASANSAILEACEQGILRNVSVMAPGPALEEAARLLAGHAEICFGLHLTLNAEWDEVKWRPVLPPEQVPSLIDENGYFLPTPMHLHERGFSVEEAMAEMEAQLHQVRSAGFHVSYIDQHMGFGWLGDLSGRIAAIAAREGLFDAQAVHGLPRPQSEGQERSKPDADANSASRSEALVNSWIAKVQSAEPGVYSIVTHPGRDEPDMQRLFHGDQAPGEVAAEREADRAALCDPRLRAAFEEMGVQVIQYRDLSDPHV